MDSFSPSSGRRRPKINMMYYADKIWNAHEMLENATTQRLTHSSGRIIWQDYEVLYSTESTANLDGDIHPGLG